MICCGGGGVKFDWISVVCAPSNTESCYIMSCMVALELGKQAATLVQPMPPEIQLSYWFDSVH